MCLDRLMPLKTKILQDWRTGISAITLKNVIVDAAATNILTMVNGNVTHENLLGSVKQSPGKVH